MYYTGDYYRGDYYRGDPGIFGFLGNIAKTALRVGVGAATGFFTGGGVKGAIIGAAGGAGTATVANIRESTMAAGGSSSAYTPAMKARHAEIVARGGSGLLQRGGLAMQGGAPGMAMTAPGQFVRRMHWNRSTYITRGGGTSRWPVGLAVHPKGTEPVPSRRMNPANPRALRRAIHRMTGFGRIVKRMKRAIARASSAVGNVHRGRRAPVRRR
jgi:hypothetical protein